MKWFLHKFYEHHATKCTKNIHGSLSVWMLKIAIKEEQDV